MTAAKGEDLYNAADDGDEKKARALLDEGVRPDAWKDLLGRTAFHRA